MHFPAILPQPFFQWLLHTSWQAGILVCLILLIQRVLGHRIGIRGRYWMWLVVLIRLSMFWAPPSPVSVHNFLPAPQLSTRGPAAAAQSGSVGPALAAMDRASAAGGHGKAGPTANRARKTQAATSPGLQVKHWPEDLAMVLFLFWLAGACTLAGYVTASHIRLRRIVRRTPAVINRPVLRLLKDCQRQMGIRRAVGVIATDRIDSPALLGCLRPQLLLPKQTIGELSPRGLRHVFLHELAHLRRDDVVIGYLMTLLQVLHWFNPLIALGFRRMRADREIVCDALALSALGPDETTAYGHTIVHELEQLQMLRPRWMLAALSGDRARIRERIAMISQFRSETYRWSPLAFVLIGLLACTGLTDGLPVAKPVVYGPAKVWPATHQDKHANIVRIHIQHRDTGRYLVAHEETVTCDANAPGDEGLWEARFDEDFGARDQIVYFYSVTTRKYLTSDKEGNLAVNGLEPDETARWSAWARTDGAWIMPRQFSYSYLRPVGQGQVRAVYGTAPSSGWDIDQLWRVKTSDNPKSNPEWRRQRVPGPD